MLSLKKSFLIGFVLLSFSPTFQSCKLFQPIQITSPFSAELVKDINALGMEADMLYATLEAQSDKAFDTYASQYGSMEVLSNSIVARLEAMPKSAPMLIQAKSMQDLIVSYKSTHKRKIKLNDSEIRGNRAYFKSLLKPLFVSAMALK